MKSGISNFCNILMLINGKYLVLSKLKFSQAYKTPKLNFVLTDLLILFVLSLKTRIGSYNQHIKSQHLFATEMISNQSHEVYIS